MESHTMYWEGALVPCVRTTQKQKFVDPRYQKYHRWKQEFRLWANTQGFPEELDLKKSYSISISIGLKGRARYDLDNAVKGVLDALFKQDRRILTINATIYEGEDICRDEYVEVTLEDMP